MYLSSSYFKKEGNFMLVPMLVRLGCYSTNTMNFPYDMWKLVVGSKYSSEHHIPFFRLRQSRYLGIPLIIILHNQSFALYINTKTYLF